MSEIILSNTNNHYDYSNGSMVVNINPGLVTKSATSTTTTPTSYPDRTQQQYTAYSDYGFQTMPMGYAPVPNYQMSRLGYFPDHPTGQPDSPEPISSSSSASPSPPINNSGPSLVQSTVSSHPIEDSALSSSPTSDSPTTRYASPTSARVKEMITRANSVPMEFYHTEFLEYSKETYEKKMESKRNKRKRSCHEDPVSKKRRGVYEKEESDEEESDDEDKADDLQVSNAELRRQIHIQSEQKRRAQIKDGFDELRKHLPGCNNKKMSKAALLTRTVQQLQHLKGMQTELLSEVERLIQENEALKKFQHGILQRQAMEKMYTF
ncbi:hypothetical protein BDB01DRAFT_849728 [Pilobolus umbonatus]|nr:hypothetical protein BDB01DRAFT_849728 [Pilobolus umbonatus]